MTLLFLALFPQDRWLYLFVTATFVAFCTYMMGHSSRWYFWSIGGYVMPLLALASGVSSPNAFETVALRLQQTTLGVVAFTVVALLVWPQSAAPNLRKTVSELADLQRRLLATISACSPASTGRPNMDKPAAYRIQVDGVIPGDWPSAYSRNDPKLRLLGPLCFGVWLIE